MGFIEKIERKRQQEAKQELGRQAELERQQQISSQEALAREERGLRESQRKGQIFIEEANDLIGLLDRFNQLFQGHEGYFRDVAQFSGFNLAEIIYMTFQSPITMPEDRNKPHYKLYETGSGFIKQQIQVKRELDRRLVTSELFLKQCEDQLFHSSDKDYLADEDKKWPWTENWPTKNPSTRFFGDNIVESGVPLSRSTKRGLDEPQEVGIGICFIRHMESRGDANVLMKLFNKHHDFLVENWYHAVYIRVAPPAVAVITGSNQRRLGLDDIRQFDKSLAEAFQNPTLIYTSRKEEWRPPSPPHYDPYADAGHGGPCLPKNALISTPMGSRRIENLKIGDSVWTVNKTGERVVSSIIKNARVAAASNHRMVNILLDDGRELFVSPGHPDIDGKPLTELIKGGCLDGAIVISVDTISYKGKYTYDILPAGDTGGYWANNILLGSTLSAKHGWVPWLELESGTNGNQGKNFLIQTLLR